MFHFLIFDINNIAFLWSTNFPNDVYVKYNLVGLLSRFASHTQTSETDLVAIYYIVVILIGGSFSCDCATYSYRKMHLDFQFTTWMLSYVYRFVEGWLASEQPFSLGSKRSLVIYYIMEIFQMYNGTTESIYKILCKYLTPEPALIIGRLLSLLQVIPEWIVPVKYLITIRIFFPENCKLIHACKSNSCTFPRKLIYNCCVPILLIARW